MQSCAACVVRAGGRGRAWSQDSWGQFPALGGEWVLIIGGQEARPHSRPYMAFVKIEKGGNQRSKCGGFLIREDVVVTAAHCNCNLGQPVPHPEAKSKLAPPTGESAEIWSGSHHS
uniref:Peptidase S1 domain-containing protein n=1 Tax=Chrysemys picta bellii TaxID=8478 RepID=A0A8C3H9I2_CHRPI